MSTSEHSRSQLVRPWKAVSVTVELHGGLNEACDVQRRFLVREGRADDVGSCVTLALIAAPDSDVSIWRASMLEDVESPDRLLVVADTADEVIGYGRVLRFVPEPDAPTDIAPAGYYLMGMVVHLDHRRKGVGAALTQARIDWVSERAEAAWYFANERNAASIALHEPFGFEEVTRSFFYPRVDFDRGGGILFRLRFTRPGSNEDPEPIRGS